MEYFCDYVSTWTWCRRFFSHCVHGSIYKLMENLLKFIAFVVVPRSCAICTKTGLLIFQFNKFCQIYKKNWSSKVYEINFLKMNSPAEDSINTWIRSVVFILHNNIVGYISLQRFTLQGLIFQLDNNHLFGYLFGTTDMSYIWVKVFKNGPSKGCGRQSLKNYTWSILEYLDPYNIETYENYCFMCNFFIVFLKKLLNHVQMNSLSRFWRTISDSEF